MCVGCKKCITLLYNFLIKIYTKGNKEVTQTKHVQNIKGQRATTLSTAHRKRLSDVNVPGDVQGRPASFPSCTGGEAADPTQRRRWWRRLPSARAAKRRISLDDVPDGVVTQLHVGNSTTTNFWPATWPSNALSVSQIRLTCHVLRRTAFRASQSRGRSCRCHCSSVDVTYANTRCGSHLAAACGQVS